MNYDTGLCVVVTKRKTVHEYEISDEFWNKIKPLLPLPKPKKKPGIRKDDKKILSGIFYVLRTGCQWKALPRCYGAPSTVHDRFQEWRDAGSFEKVWQAIDGAMTKAPLGGAFNRPSMTMEFKISVWMDKGYDYPDNRELVKGYGYTAHIRAVENKI